MISLAHRSRHWALRWLIALGIAAVAPATAQADQVALVKAILKGDQAVKELPASQLRIVRAGESLRGSTETALFVDDEIETGDDVVTVIEFLEADGREFAEITLAPNSRIRISAPSSIIGRLGKFLAALDGFFEIGLKGGFVLGVRGTEFEVDVSADETADLRVLEGTVSVGSTDNLAGGGARAAAEGPDRPPPTAESSNRPPPIAAGAGSHLGLGVSQGEIGRVSTIVKIENRCRRRHSFLAAGPSNLGWVRIPASQRVLVDGRDSVLREYELLVDASFVEPGRYEGQIQIGCLDCDEPGCGPPPQGPPLVIEVLGSPSVGRLERVTLRRDQAPAPEPMQEPEVRSVLEWSSDALVRTQPSFAAAHEPPNFADIEERSGIFREARSKAILQDSASAHEILGDVYSDWGRDQRALSAYGKAVVSEPVRESAPRLLLKRGRANRRVGRLDHAEELLGRALAAEPQSGRAHNALGNVYMDRADVARDRQEQGRASQWLDRSLDAFHSAARLSAEGSSTGDERRILGVSATNSGRVRLAQGELLTAAGEPDKAAEIYSQGNRDLQLAREAYPDYPFALLVQGGVEQQRGRLAGGRGDKSASALAFDGAEAAYLEALGAHPDLAPAYYRLGTLWEDRGDRRRAIEQYRQAVREQPAYAKAYFKLGSLTEDEDPELAARYYGTFLKLEPEDLRDGSRADQARRLAEDPTGPTRPTPLPTPTPTPTPPPPSGKLVKVPRISKKLGGGTVRVERFRERLLDSGFVPGIVRTNPDCRQEGTLIGSDPPRNGRVPEGTTVDILVAGLGPNPKSVPNLAGMPQEDARRALVSAGLSVGTIEERPSDNPVGTVTAQAPGPQTQLAAGCEVRLTVASLVEVPSLTGKTQTAAKRTAERAGLRLGKVRTQKTTEGEDGLVMSQDPRRGQKVPWGTAVNLVIADLWVEVPPVVGRDRDSAVALLKGMGFRVRVEEQKDSGRKVVRQDPPAKRLVKPSSTTITLWLDRVVQ